MEHISIKKNYMYNTVYQILVLIIPFITVPYTSRVFGADGVGIQSYVNSIGAYFNLFAALGTSIYGQREIAAARDDKEKRSKLFLEIECVSAIATLACLILWICLILISDKYRSYYLVLTISIISVGFDISWFFNGLENFKITVTRNIIIRLIGVAVLFIFVREKNDILLYVGLTAATGMLGNISLWFGLPRFICKVTLRELQIKHHFREVIVYFIPSLALSICTVLDKIMIGVITANSYENGYYEQAQKLITMIKTLIVSLNTVMSSRMSFLFTNGKIDEMKEKIRTSLEFVLILGIPMSLGVAGVSQSFVPLFFGEGYGKVISLICVCSPLILVTSISNLIGHQYMIPSGQRARSSKAVIAGAVINFCLNALFIPRLASMGAAIASVVAEIAITCIYIYMSGEFITIKMIFVNAYKKIIAGLAMLGVLLGIGNINNMGFLSILFQVIAGSATYGVILLILRDSTCLKFMTIGLEKLKYKDE